MQKRLAVCGALFPSLLVSQEVSQSTEPALGSWDWIWVNIQSLDSLVALLIALVGGATWLYFKLRGQSPQSKDNPQNAPLTHPHQQDELEQTYLAELDKRCEFLRLDLIVKPILDRGLRLSLSEIYQDQHIRLWTEDKAKKSPNSLQERHEAEPLPLMQALAELTTNHLVIRGGVGAGKTSFVNYLTHCLIQSHQGHIIHALPTQLIRRPVVRLLLRKVGLGLHTSSPINPASVIWQAIHQELSELVHSGTGAVNKDLKPEIEAFISAYSKRLKQDGIVLLDGLDEVSENQGKRAQLRHAIEAFVQDAPKALAIVTGRPYAYERQEQKLAYFQQADLSPMTEAQIRAFVAHWYQVARQPNGWTEAQAEKRAQQLSDEIFSRPYLPEMASNAMLLTLFVGLDYADIRLPSSRAKLYEEAVELLLQRWHQSLKDYRANLETAEQEGLLVLERSRDELLKALKTLAYKTYLDLTPALGEKTETVALDFDHAVIIGHLYKPFGQSCDHDHLLYFLQYRSAILIAGHQEESCQFAHKSFHEYLAASHLMSLPNWEEKIEALLRRNQDWWREVFLLLVKKYADQQEGKAIQFLQHLLRHYSSQTTSAAEQRLVLLVATSALELKLADKLDEDISYRKLYECLQTSLVNIMQASDLELRERAEAGRLLGELGDPRRGVSIIRAGEYQGLPDIAWVSIPQDSFDMGSVEDDEQASDDEKPPHKVLVKAFQISRYPITNAQYACFVQAGGYQTERYWQLTQAGLAWWKANQSHEPSLWNNRTFNNPNHPVVGVSWYEALAFCAWLNDTGLYQTVRLPREEEWEYAARGTEGWRYAWGNQPEPNLGNYAETGIGQTSAVGLFPAGQAFQALDGSGLYDISGNVWEWTNSPWGKDWRKPAYTYAQWEVQRLEREQLEAEADMLRIIRGGSWDDVAVNLRCALRIRFHPFMRSDYLGFRVVDCP